MSVLPKEFIICFLYERIYVWLKLKNSDSLSTTVCFTLSKSVRVVTEEKDTYKWEKSEACDHGVCILKQI